MNRQKSFSPLPTHWVMFGVALALTATMYGLYGANIAQWRNSPDFGWRTMYDSGANVVAEVFDAGKAAGLRASDTILAINGRPYGTFEELFFGNLRTSEPGSVNTYTVIRDGTRVDVSVTTGRLGFPAVLRRSGPLFAMGLVYVLIGALVFLMKPRAIESWLFFVMTCFTGMRVSFAAPADLIRPTWFYDLRFLNEALLPASLIHLATRFPQTRAFIRRRPALALAPYVPSILLFVALNLTATAYWNIPRAVFMLSQVYTLLGISLFLASMTWNFLKEASLIVRLQSQVIFAGILLAFLIPTTDLISRFLWRVHLFPDPALSFVAFLILFPLSIGYTIVKHDLFAIDVIVRRTYGYVLSTASIVAAYAVIVSTLNVAFRSTEVSRSPLFSIGFAVGVVLVFEPLHRRFQKLVDRVFYRQHYDYRKTIKSISEAMTSLFDEDRILRTLIDSVTGEMFLENATVLLTQSPANGYIARATAGMAPDDSPSLAGDDPLVRLVKTRGDTIARHEIQLNPLYEPNRVTLLNGFRALSAELLVPMKYKDELLGIISLGRKKSGKLFTAEDLDLLKTLASQSAIAIENTKLFQEHLEKGRIEEELKIAREIQTSMLPDRAPEIPGFAIAARSIPAREVGGDFYDFVPMTAGRDDRRLGIVVGDVTGKGVSGALLMAAARSTYRVLLESHPTVADVMHLANRRLHRDIKKGTFVALLYAVLDPHEKALAFANAGQTQPVLYQNGAAAPFYLETDGDRFPLGIVPDCTYKETAVRLAPGDVLVFYTDGVVEAMNAHGELYGFDRLLKAVAEGRDHDAPEALQSLLDDISRHVGDVEPHDDVTIVVVKVLGV